MPPAPFVPAPQAGTQKWSPSCGFPLEPAPAQAGAGMNEEI
jgi:hypothetical protein